MKDLIERLRIVGGVGDDAADFIEQQAAEIERLTATVKILQALHDEDTLTHIALQAKLSAMEAVEPVANVEPTKLDEIEQYRLQMAGISTAALGYWKEGDDIHPDYDTVALRDVAKLYAKYDRLYKAVQPQAHGEAIVGRSCKVGGPCVSGKASECACLELPAPEHPQASEPAWLPIETAPKDGRKIIVTYTNRNNFKRTVMACWFTKEQAEETDNDGVGLEEGWYECIDNWGEYTSVAIHEGEPTHWMPLPAAPEATK